MRTKTREHEWMEMKVTPVAVVDMDGEPEVVSKGDEPHIRVGCFVCNMGLAEGFGIPCPGQDLFE